MTDSVAVDAKRILLRYGAPIAILDKVSESHRIEFAREIAKTMLPERESRLRELLWEHGYANEGAAPASKRKSRGKAKATPKASAKRRGEAEPEAKGRTKGKSTGGTGKSAKKRR